MKQRRLRKAQFLELGPSDKKAYLKAYPKSKFRNLIEPKSNKGRITKKVFLELSPKGQQEYLSKFPKSKFGNLASAQGNKKAAQRKLDKVNKVIQRTSKAIQRLTDAFKQRKAKLKSRGLSGVKQIAILDKNFKSAIESQKLKLDDARSQIKEIIAEYKG